MKTITFKHEGENVSIEFLNNGLFNSDLEEQKLIAKYGHASSFNLERQDSHKVITSLTLSIFNINKDGFHYGDCEIEDAKYAYAETVRRYIGEAKDSLRSARYDDKLMKVDFIGQHHLCDIVLQYMSAYYIDYDSDFPNRTLDEYYAEALGYKQIADAKAAALEALTEF